MRMLLLIGTVAWFATSSNAIIREYGLCDDEILQPTERLVSHFYYNFIKVAAGTVDTDDVICSPPVVAMRIVMKTVNNPDDFDSTRRLLMGFPQDSEASMRQVRCLYERFEDIALDAQFATFSNGSTPILETPFFKEPFEIMQTENNGLKSIIIDWFGHDNIDDPKKVLEKKNKLSWLLNPVFEKPITLFASLVKFNGAFETKLNVDKTSNRRFWVNRESYIDAEFMRGIGNYKRGRIANLQSEFIGIPVKGNTNKGDTMAYFIFSDTMNGFKYLKNNLGLITVGEFVNAREEKVEVRLPKFVITSTIDVTPTFTSRTISLDKEKNYGNVKSEGYHIHKTSLEMGERGFGSANLATTKLRRKESILRRLVPKCNVGANDANEADSEFTLNRPFVVMIVTEMDKVPVLTAIVTEPTEKKRWDSSDPEILSGGNYGKLDMKRH